MSAVASHIIGGMLNERVLWDLQTLFVYRLSYLPVNCLCRPEHRQNHQLEGRSWIMMNYPYSPELLDHRRYLKVLRDLLVRQRAQGHWAEVVWALPVDRSSSLELLLDG